MSLFFRTRPGVTYPYLQNLFEGVVNFRKLSPGGWGSLGRSPYAPGSFSPIQIIKSKNIGVKFASFMGELRGGRRFVKTDKRPGKVYRKCVGFEEFSNRHLYLYFVLFPFKLFPTLTHLSFCEGPQITRIDTDQKNKKNRVICGHFFLSSPGVGGNTLHALCSVLFLSIGKT